MPRWASKVDTTHREIVDAFRKSGYSVVSLAGVGKGCPDLAVGRGGRTWLVEVKAAKGKLRESQERFRAQWQGAYVVCRSVDDVIGLNG